MLDLTARRPAVVLSPRELEVIALLGGGMTLKEIAAALEIATGTVKSYLARARIRTGSRNNAQLVRDTRRP